jgi:hypothetical protein
MFLGHFAAGFAARPLAPRASLGTLLLACQFIDLLWPTFLMLGWERVRIEPGVTAGNPLVFEHYPISHSLLAVVGWAIALGTMSWLTRRDLRAALVIAALVLSHWLLDAIVHVPDLPLSPAGDARIGLGLWNSPSIEFIVHDANAAGSAPPSVQAIAWIGQLQWLIVGWGYWVDRHRAPRPMMLRSRTG